MALAVPGLLRSGHSWAHCLGPRGVRCSWRWGRRLTEEPKQDAWPKNGRFLLSLGSRCDGSCFWLVLLPGCRLPLLPWRPFESSQRPFSGKLEGHCGSPECHVESLACSRLQQCLAGRAGRWLCGLWRLQVCLCHVLETKDLLDGPPQNPGLPTQVLFPTAGTSRSHEAAQLSELGFLSGHALLVLRVLLEKWGC